MKGLNALFFDIAARLDGPLSMGSYQSEDVVFVLKDISKNVLEKSNEEREALIQGGIHYSTMLPVEWHGKSSSFSVKPRL